MSRSTSWVFFAGNAKPSSMRRALPHRLGAEFPVVLVTEPFSLIRERRWPSLAARVRTRSDLPHLREYTPIHFPERIPLCGPKIKEFGAKTLRRELDCLLAPPGSGRRVVCYNSPGQYPLVGTLGEELSVYLAIDDRTVTVQGEAIAGELEAERELLARVDRVVCVSEPLAETLRARSLGNRDIRVDVLGNGYDEQLFDPDRQWAEPPALREIPRPRILVAGHISQRIDWVAVAEAMRLRPQYSWIFVGPADADAAAEILRVRNASGAAVFLYEPVAYEDVPAWIAHCDLCAVPYRLNKFTMASSPLKAIEYLACGAPTLSTEIPSLLPLSDAIAWVREGDPISYAKALDALEAQGRARAAVETRRAAAQKHGWTSKARKFRDLLID